MEEAGTDLTELQRRAVAATARIVEGVRPEQLADPTPCADRVPAAPITPSGRRRQDGRA